MKINKNKIIKERIEKIFNQNIKWEDDIVLFNKMREIILNYNENMIYENLKNIKEPDNIESFVEYINTLQNLYKQTIASILIVEKRINSAYKYVMNKKSFKNENFSLLNKKIFDLKNEDENKYNQIKNILFNESKNEKFFLFSLEICRITRNEIIHNDWVGLINIKINLQKKIKKIIDEKMINDIKNEGILFEEESLKLIDCLKIIDWLMESNNLRNNYDNIKNKINKLVIKKY